MNKHLESVRKLVFVDVKSVVRGPKDQMLAFSRKVQTKTPLA